MDIRSRAKADWWETMGIMGGGGRASLLCNSLSSQSTCCSGWMAGNFRAHSSILWIGRVLAWSLPFSAQVLRNVHSWCGGEFPTSALLCRVTGTFPYCWIAWHFVQVTADLSFCAFHVGFGVGLFFSLRSSHIKTVSASYSGKHNMKQDE